MLNEIIDKIGLDEIEKGLFNEDLTGSLVFLLNEDVIKQIDMSDEGDKTYLEEKEYIKQRLFYSNYINSDKAVVQDKKYKTIKMALGGTKFSISFNVSKLIENADKPNGEKSYNSDYRRIFEDIISDYYETLKNKFKIKIDNEEKIINKYSDIIFNEIMKSKNKKKKVRIFIEASLEEYKNEFEKYFYLMISDSDTETGIRKDKALFKLFKEQDAVKVALFSTLNADKPLLSNVGARLLYPHVYNKENLMKFYKLKKYMEMNIKKQKFPLDDKGSIVIYDCKEKRIDDYEQSVYKRKSDEDEYKFTIEDLLDFNLNSKRIKSRKMLIEELNSYIDYSITKTPTRGRARNLNQKYKNILLWCTYNEKEKKYNFAIDDEMFDIKIKSLLEDILIYNRIERAKDEYAILNMRKILNIKFAINKYNQITNIKGEDILNIKESFKNKILSKDEEKFETNQEFIFAIGQLAICLVNKSKGKKMNSLIAGYQNARDYQRLINLLDSDMKKYRYITMLGSKENKVFGMIKFYVRENKIKGFISNESKDWLDIGLYSKNLFYVKRGDE